jgi:hypothetical protein
MHILDRIKKYENIHIVFWLIKDTCWMLELKTAGTIVMFPTIYVAIYIAYKTRATPELYINLAILFWIIANSYWMMIEFFNDNEFKNAAIIPFILGFIFVIIFYVKVLFFKSPGAGPESNPVK